MHPFKHFATITKHRHRVIIHCFRAGIGFQGLFHDLSKYSPTEFIPGMKHYLGTKSPNEGERDVLGYSTAWMHHQGRNKHHFEYWHDYNKETHRMTPVPMPDRYIKEMFCDRVAASKVYMRKAYNDRAPLEYFNRAHKNYSIHPETAKKLEKLLVMLAEKGEKETFRYIRGRKEL